MYILLPWVVCAYACVCACVRVCVPVSFGSGFWSGRPRTGLHTSHAAAECPRGYCFVTTQSYVKPIFSTFSANGMCWAKNIGSVGLPIKSSSSVNNPWWPCTTWWLGRGSRSLLLRILLREGEGLTFKWAPIIYSSQLPWKVCISHLSILLWRTVKVRERKWVNRSGFPGQCWEAVPYTSGSWMPTMHAVALKTLFCLSILLSSILPGIHSPSQFKIFIWKGEYITTISGNLMSMIMTRRQP